MKRSEQIIQLQSQLRGLETETIPYVRKVLKEYDLLENKMKPFSDSIYWRLTRNEIKLCLFSLETKAEHYVNKIQKLQQLDLFENADS